MGALIKIIIAALQALSKNAARYGWEIVRSAILLALYDLRDKIKNTAEEEAQELEEFLISLSADMKEKIGAYLVDGVNDNLGLRGTANEITSIDGAHIAGKIQAAIIDNVNVGGGSIVTGAMIQQIRAGEIQTKGWAARGKAVTADLASQQAYWQAKLDALTTKQRAARLANRARQAKYRKTHRRVSHWIEKI